MCSLRSIFLLTAVSCLLAYSDSASVKSMNKENLTYGKHLVPVNSESCYNTQPDGSAVPVTCPQPDAKECAILSFEGNGQRFVEYACATIDACKNPDIICKQVAQQEPFPISNCTLKCCMGTNCNKPTTSMQLRASPPNPLSVQGLTLNKAMTSPANVVSCYVTEPDQTVVSMSCPMSEADQCASIAFDMAIGGTKMHETAYACANDRVCKDPKAICDEITKEIPFPISNCVVKCCSGDNCNKPTMQRIDNGGLGAASLLPSLHGMVRNKIMTSPANAPSCYVTQTDQSVKAETCMSYADGCATILVGMKTPVGEIDSNIYQCGLKEMCTTPSSFCKQIAKALPYPMLKCEITCCTGDDCNKPGLKQIGTKGTVASIAPMVGSAMAKQGIAQRRVGLYRLPTNAMSCYVTDAQSLSVVSEQCHFANEDRCGVVTVDFVGPSGISINETIYVCTFESLCKDPSMFCKEIAKQVPYKMLSCTLDCCKGDNCNHP